MKEINYSQVGDYQMPNLKGMEPVLNSRYARMRVNYLKTHHQGYLFSLKISNQLNIHLQEIEKQMELRMETLMNQLLEQYPAPNKELKQLEWIQHMNNLKMQAEETAIREIIYN
ncbi:TnpV protein [Candidatus Stoquefichus massiliensis]|uniref:TnpV protein n=1 Tax=Candidatus Stoquefichus massiliensis TaxID=1470350 RepID=UPI0009DBCCD0